jgi:hypothetical protein
MGIVEAIRSILLNIPATTDVEAMTILKGVAGRGEDQYGSKLRNWLESNPNGFSEPVEVEAVDHVRDSGVDVILTGQISKARIGFQIKSDNDLTNKGFTRELKAQITDARSWGLSLYVIILACRPTKDNQQKYLHIVNEIGRSPDNFVQIITPPRAAGLMRAFGAPLSVPRNAGRGWSDFFIAVRQSDLISRYIDDWNGLLPDERFKPPKEFDEILEAVRTTPLTILTGSPAIGKTFSALQILWRDFLEGREVEWITPARFIETEGPIPETHAPHDMRRRIDLLTRHLGLEAPQPPLDATEFIAAHLKPNGTIYIEDPFGKTDDEFAYSIHTYRFFDLDKFVAAVSEGATRHGCRILITSREALFERWLTECETRRLIRPNFTFKRISTHSYKPGQRLALARQLAFTRNVANIEEAAQTIASHVHIPFDVELIARDIPVGATTEQVMGVVQQFKGTRTESLQNRIIAETDGERLFLLLLVALSESRSADRNNFHAAYTELLSMLSMEEDSKEAMAKAIQRYRPFISRSEITVMERNPAGKGINLVRKNDSSAYHLESVHSTVDEAITQYLRSTSRTWLDFVAASLGKTVTGLSSRNAQTKIALLFIRWGIGQHKGAAQDGMLRAIFEQENGHLEESILMSMWTSLPLEFREEFFSYLASRSFAEVSRTCSLLNIIDMPAEDAWRLLRLQLNQRAMGVSLMPSFGGHPWGFLANHLTEIPPDFRSELDRKAEDEPSLFTYALSEVLVEHWADLPEAWRKAFLHPKSASSEHAQGNFLIALAQHWDNIPSELKNVFYDRTKHDEYVIRAKAAIAALVYHESAPQEMEPVYMATLQDPQIHVPLEVMHQGLGEADHDRRFAEALYELADEAVATTMLGYLIYRGEFKVEWKHQLAFSCVTKGGDLACGELAYHCLTHNNLMEFMGYRLTDSPRDEPAPIRLAWLWAYANSEGKRPALTDEEVIELINGLPAKYRQLVLFYFSVQANYLPHSLEYYVEKLGVMSDADIGAINEGEEQRETPGGSRSLYGFPSTQFIES